MPYEHAMRTASVYFGSTPALVDAPTESGLRVLVPDTFSSGQQNVRVEMGGPNLAIVRSEFTGFTVQRSWIEVLTWLLLPVFLGLLGLSGWTNYRLFTQQRDHQAQITRLQEASKGRLSGSTPKSLHEDLLPLDPNVGRVPEVPPELVLACTARQCVLFAGSGVGRSGAAELRGNAEQDHRRKLRKRTGSTRGMNSAACSSWVRSAVAAVLQTWLDPKAGTLAELLRRAYVPGPNASTKMYPNTRAYPIVGVLNWTWDRWLATEVSAKLPRREGVPPPRLAICPPHRHAFLRQPPWPMLPRLRPAYEPAGPGHSGLHT